MSKDVYEIDKDGFADDWHIVLKNGKYFAEFVDLEIAEKFAKQMNGDLVPNSKIKKEKIEAIIERLKKDVEQDFDDDKTSHSELLRMVEELIK